MTNTFPLLSLPYLCQKGIMDCWNPLEFFTFAKLSQRTMRIATFIKKRMSYIVAIYPSQYDRCYFEMKVPGEDWLTFWNFCSLSYSDRDYGKPNGYVIRSSNRYLGLLDLTRDVLNVFKTSNNSIHMRLNRRVTKYQLSKFLNFVNSMETNPKHIDFFFELEEGRIQQTMNDLSKNISDLTIFSYCAQNVSIDVPKFKVMNKLYVRGDCSWLYPTFLLQVDPIRTYMQGLIWTSGEVNQLLKCWMEGKMRLKKCRLYFEHQIHIKEILKGLSAELMDPRTNVKSFQYDTGSEIKTIRIHGGIYLKRSDGKLIVITHYGYKQVTDEDVPQKVIDEYEEAVKNWNEEDVLDLYDLTEPFENMGILKKPWFRSNDMLCMYSE